MICPECNKGMVSVPSQNNRLIPCPRCNGSGIAYCCDGEDYDAKCHLDGKYGQFKGNQ